MKTLIVRDDRLPNPGNAKIVVPEGPASVQYIRQTAQSVTSTNPVFTVQSPSPGAGLGRTVYIRAVGSFSVTGTNLDQLLLTDRVALRQMCLWQMCQSATMTFGSATISSGNLVLGLDGLLRVANALDSVPSVQSGGPAGFDTCASYSQVVGRADSPFRAVGDWQPSSCAQTSRTVGITNVTTNAAPSTTMTVSFDLFTPLILPPMAYTEEGRHIAIYGLKNGFQLTMSYGNFARGLSLALGGTTATVTNVDLAFTDQTIYTEFISPDERSGVPSIERPIYRYNCPQYEFFTTAMPNINAGASGTGSSTSIPFAVVPERIAIWVQPGETDRTTTVQNACSWSSFFLPIRSLTCVAGQNSGALNSTDQVNLWKISSRNGAVDVPYWMYNGDPQVTSSNAATAVNQAKGSGGVVLLDVASDLGLPPGVVPGMTMTYTFQATLTCFNQSPDNLTNPNIVVMPIYPGQLQTGAEGEFRCIGGVPGHEMRDMTDASIIDASDYRAMLRSAGVGGSIGSWFRDLGRKIRHSAYKTGDAIKHAAYKVGDAVKHEAWQVGDHLKSAGYDVGRRLEGVADHALQAAAHGVASAVTHGGRRAPRSMLYG